MQTNKKGFFLVGEHAINLIIAALCIAALFYFGYRLYSTVSERHQIEQATAEMGYMKTTIEELYKTGGEKDYLLLSPGGWYLVGWPEETGLMPNYCFIKGWKKCLCFCSSKGSPTPAAMKDTCSNDETCFEIKSGNFSVKYVYTWDNPRFKTILWMVELFKGPLMSPIPIEVLVEDYGGKISINYDKTIDKLSIIPK
jgi:hypothetical protein